jgi:hypothetical protein
MRSQSFSFQFQEVDSTQDLVLIDALYHSSLSVSVSFDGTLYGSLQVWVSLDGQTWAEYEDASQEVLSGTEEYIIDWTLPIAARYLKLVIGVDSGFGDISGQVMLKGER